MKTVLNIFFRHEGVWTQIKLFKLNICATLSLVFWFCILSALNMAEVIETKKKVLKIICLVLLLILIVEKSVTFLFPSNPLNGMNVPLCTLPSFILYFIYFLFSISKVSYNYLFGILFGDIFLFCTKICYFFIWNINVLESEDKFANFFFFVLSILSNIVFKILFMFYFVLASKKPFFSLFSLSFPWYFLIWEFLFSAIVAKGHEEYSSRASHSIVVT